MNDAQHKSATADTARNIAYAMISIYGGMLVAIGIIAAIKTGEEGKVWIELLKSGFLILGGGLTTIIGYYFGSRPVQAAQEAAEKAIGELEEQKEEFAAFKRQFTPTEDEEGLIVPEEEEISED